MKAPERIPLGRRTADLLEEEIRSGRWSHQLPGYRVLCAGMGVSRGTMDTALQILAQREIILPSHGKRARLIHPDIQAVTARRDNCKCLLVLSDEPHQKQDLVARQIIEKTTTLFTRKGWTVDFESCSEYAKGSPGPVMERMLANRNDYRWLLLRPNFEIINWCMEHQLPIICVGGDPQHLKPPIVSVRWVDMLRGSTQHLTQLGHRRICAMTGYYSSDAHKVLTEAMEKALASEGIPFHPTYNLPEIKDSDPLSFKRSLSDLFAISPPSALIVTEARHLITVYSYCQENGLNIPRDLSVILTMESEHMEWFCPLPAHYKFPINRFVRTLSRWVEDYPLTEIDLVAVKPRFCEGDSLASNMNHNLSD